MHPNTRRRSPQEVTVRVLAFAPAETLAWIEADVAGQAISLQIARSVQQVIASLVEDPPPRATILVVELDAPSPLDLLKLHTIRERGWFGAIVGLGDVPAPLRISLAIAHVISPPYRKGALRTAISQAGVRLETAKSPKGFY